MEPVADLEGSRAIVESYLDLMRWMTMMVWWDGETAGDVAVLVRLN